MRESEKKQKSIEAILEKTKDLLKDDFPSLIYPLNMLQFQKSPKKIKSLCTDGECILYSPSAVAAAFERNRYKQLKTEMMHILLHGLLGHLDMDGHYADRDLLWAVMDLEVGNLINRLVNESTIQLKKSPHFYGWNAYYKELHGMDIYYKERGCTDSRVERLRKDGSIRSDNHKYWRKRSSKSSEGAGSTEIGEKKSIWAEIREMLGGATADADTLINTLKKSKEFLNGYGSEEGTDKEWIIACDENDHSYQRVLRELLTMKEDQKADPDAIDRALYQYGLDLYGNIPLIEPPDSEERLQINTICLAIDSSGSCSGETACEFLRETMNVFRDVKQLSSKCEVYFFVCDNEIQQEEHYASMDMIQEDWSELEMYGWGGTSFVPVFQRIQELQEEEGKSIDCLIYLTDSYGDCIEEKPEYPVFFVLPSDQEDENGELDYMTGLPEWIHFIGLEGEK